MILASSILAVSIGIPAVAWFKYLSPGAQSAQAENQMLEQQAPAAGEAKAPAPGTIDVQVALANHVDAAQDLVVFVYARAWQGPPMPLAIQRMTVADLPVQLSLDESMAMTPEMTIATFPQLEVIARISQTGSARSAPGDWEVSSGPIELDALTGPLELTIESQLP